MKDWELKIEIVDLAFGFCSVFNWAGLCLGPALEEYLSGVQFNGYPSHSVPIHMDHSNLCLSTRVTVMSKMQ